MRMDDDTAEVVDIIGTTMDVTPASVQHALECVGSLGGHGGVNIPSPAPELGQIIGGACSFADLYPKFSHGVEEPPPPRHHRLQQLAVQRIW